MPDPKHTRPTPTVGAHTSDLDSTLAEPQFSGSLLVGSTRRVAAALPALDKVAGVTFAGPAIINDVGTYDPPVEMGGPIRCRPDRITLRINPDRLDSVVISDPSSHGPAMVRMFDNSGGTSHATYLTQTSDELEFGTLRSMSGIPITGESTTTSEITPKTLADWADADQITQFDSILADGGLQRHDALGGLGGRGCTRVESRRVVAAMSQLAVTGVPVTLAVAGGGCVQMRHGQIDGAREHRGSMVVASGACRMMVDFDLVTECWVTKTHGVWGDTSSIELYDRRSHCVLVLTQTGTLPRSAHREWEYLMEGVAA